MNKYILSASVAAVMLLVAACSHQAPALTGESEAEVMAEVQSGEEAMVETVPESASKTEGEVMMDSETDATVKADVMVKTEASAAAGSYQDYSPALLASEQAAGKKAVLFFHADWCPFCRAADAAFQSQLSSLPDGVTVLKTDYDSQTELRQKYGVTYQHTFVQIDAEGKLVSKWNGGDVDNLKKYLK